MNKIIPSFFNLNEAAFMYLENSFKDVEKALENDVVQELVYFEKIEYSKDDYELDREYKESKKDPINFLRSNQDNMTNLTFIEIKKRRALAILRLRKEKFKIPNNYKIYDLNVLSHITNLALFFEIIINRHLFFLQVTKEISDYQYKQIEKASVINRFLFITKGENLTLNFINRLFTLRNIAVHYTATNTSKFNVSIEELKNIWRQIKKILYLFESIEQFEEETYSEILETYIEDFNDKWN